MKPIHICRFYIVFLAIIVWVGFAFCKSIGLEKPNGQVFSIPIQTQISHSYGQSFDRIQYLDETNGWAITQHTLWKTEDGGRSWSLIKEGYRPQFRVQIEGAPVAQVQDEGPPACLYGLHFIDKQNGWLVEDTRLQHTTDGGITWQGYNHPLTIIYSIRFADDKTGWVVGQMLKLPKRRGQVEKWYPAIYSTSDGGKNWKKSLMYPDNHYPFYDIWIASPNNIWVVGFFILNSRDGGSTWQEIHIKDSGIAKGTPCRVEFINQSIGWIETNTGDYLLTNDGGITWEEMKELPDALDKRY